MVIVVVIAEVTGLSSKFTLRIVYIIPQHGTLYVSQVVLILLARYIGVNMKKYIF